MSVDIILLLAVVTVQCPSRIGSRTRLPADFEGRQRSVVGCVRRYVSWENICCRSHGHPRLRSLAMDCYSARHCTRQLHCSQILGQAAPTVYAGRCDRCPSAYANYSRPLCRIDRGCYRLNGVQAEPTSSSGMMIRGSRLVCAFTGRFPMSSVCNSSQNNSGLLGRAWP
jgi:hypothetical protein